MQKSWRLSRPLRGNRYTAISRRVREFQKGLPREIRPGPGALLQRARFELGCFAEKDRSRARVAHRHGHASYDREGNEGWHIHGEQTVREGEQPASRRIRPSPIKELHHVSRCEQPLRMGNEPAAAKEKLPLEKSDADRRADHENEVEFEERLDTGDGPRVPGTLARRPQRLSSGARKESDKARADVRIPEAAYGRTRTDATKHREASADAGRQRKVRGTLRQSAILPQIGNATEKSAPRDRVRPRAVDGAEHQDEHGVSQAGEERF